MPESISRIWHVARRVLTSLPVLIVAGLFVLYILLGYFAVGPLMRHYAPRIAQSQLDSRASVREVRFDPLRLTLTVDDLRLTTPQGQPLAAFSRLFVDFAPISLFRWAWTFRQIRVDRPQVDVSIARGGAMNWDGLVRALQRGPKPQEPSNSVVRLVIDQLHITDGFVRYADADRDQPYSTRLTPLNLSLDNLSTLPRDRGDYTLSLQLPEQHATLRWKGYVGLNPLVSGGQAELSGLDLAATAQAVPGLKRLAQIAAGTATAHAAYSAVLGNSGLQWAVNDLGVQVDALSAKSGGVSLQVRQARLVQGRIDGPARTASLQALTLAGIAAASGNNRVQLKNAQLQGASLDWERMQATLRGLDLQALQAQTGLATLDAAALRIAPVQFDLRQSVLQVPQITLQDARAHLGQEQTAPWLTLPKLQVDAVRANLAQHRLHLGALDLQVGSVRLTRLADGRLDLLQALSAGAGAAPAPKAQPASAQTTDAQRNAPGWTIDLQQINAALKTLDYADQTFKQTLGLQLKDIVLGGTASARIDPRHAPALTFTGLGVRLGALTLQSDKQDLATWAQASLGPTDIALPAEGAPRIQAGPLQIDDLASRVRLAKDGLNWTRAFQPAAGVSSNPASKARQTSTPLPDFTLKSAQLRNFSAQLQDDAEPLPIRLDLIRGQASARNLSLNLREPVPVQLRFAVRQGGRFDARGQIAPQPLAGSLAVQLHDLSLMPFGDLLQPYVRLLLTSGVASAAGTVRLRAAAKAPQITYDGTAQVDNLALVEPEGRTPFLGWRKLAATGMRVDSAPLAVRVGDLQAVEPYGRIVINADRTLNVQAILLTRKPARQPAVAARLPLSLRIDRTDIRNADVDFNDQSIKPDFRVRIQKLTGVINGLSDAPESSAQVELDGQVNDYGQAIVRGQLQPFRATNDTDITLEFRNLDMASVSPYSGKFAGRTIESGRLDAKLEYKIRKAQMQGDNQFTITRLKLGPHVDSPDAINLPLDLAIAVLENSDGVIDLDLPVSGDLNNPKFSYGHIVWQAIVNVLTKIVTAPFRALGALFGGSAEQAPQDVRFAAGSAALAPPERERLLQIAEALLKRPRLELQVPPTSDPALDTAALQDATVRRQVLQKLGVTVAPDASPGPLDLGDARTRNAVQALYLDHFPTSALNALGKSLPKTEAESHALQRAMLQQVAKTVIIPDSDLRALAQARAQAVVTALTRGAKGLPVARLQIGALAKEQAESGDAVVLKLGLGTAPAAPAPAVSTSAPAGAAPAQGR